MAVTTRDYNIAEATPTAILEALESSIADLGWFEPHPQGYLSTFVSSPGSTIVSQLNKRYLVTANSLGIGANAVFDVARNFAGQIATITLVTGGENYTIVTKNNVSSSGNSVNVGNTTGIYNGMIITKTLGTGTLLANTQVANVVNTTHIVTDRAPSVALSGAGLFFQDIVTIPANTIGGNTYNISSNGASGSTLLTLFNPADMDKILPGQRVIGTNIAPLAYVVSAFNSNVILSQAHTGGVNNSVTFSDEISCLVTGAINANNLTGTANGTTITNVISNLNLYVGAEVNILAGTPQYIANSGRVLISAVSGTGPYTITLRNRENTFKGFTANGDIVFRADSGNGVNWFAQDRYTAPSTYAWGVAKMKNSNDRLGCTFWHFYVGFTGNQPSLFIKGMTGYNPIGAIGQGLAGYDTVSAAGAAATSTVSSTAGIIIGSMFNTPLTLKVRQSGVDPNFATFAFFDGNTNRNPFFISKYNNNNQPWSLNDVFLGAAYEVFQLSAYGTNDAGITFRTRTSSLARRMAEAGYTTYGVSATAALIAPYYRSTSGNRLTSAASVGDVSFYLRQEFDIQSNINDGLKVFKNIPINPYWYPISYYLPDDFGIVEVPWRSPFVRDTITISPSEVWTIIQTAQNQSTFTTMCLVARTT